MIIVDVETTGLDHVKNSILSIGAVDFSNPKNTFYGECRIWEGAVINPKALEINGFTEKQAGENPKSPKELMEEFISWVNETGNDKIGGYYTLFDYSFLKSTADKFGLDFPFSDDVYDLQTEFAVLSGIPREFAETELFFTLDDILMSLGIPAEPNPHNALRGSKYTAEAISRFKDGDNLLEEFEKFPLPSSMEK